MKRLYFGFAMAVLVTARPELYKEKEEFQYSRSSSDEGSKSGYYDAQRGNMGGNFERSHNMDSLAQHQMGGLMKQVEGELGDGTRMRTGNVFTQANSMGNYGSRHYDLSSLGSRNFHEGTSYEGSQAQSSTANRAYESHSSSSHQNNAQYNANSESRNSGYRGYQTSNLQDTQNLYDGSQYERGSQSSRNSRTYTQSGEVYDLGQQASSDLTANTNNRQRHVTILLQPGQSVNLPIRTHATTSTHTASLYNQNTENSDLQQSQLLHNQPKHYESSYSYQKQWEKHDTQPAAGLIPVDSEHYDSVVNQGSQYRNTNYNQASSHSSQHANAYNQQVASGQTRNQADFNTQQHSTSDLKNSNVYSQSGLNSDAVSQLRTHGSADANPKSYQSSYSYHKSWERQGDPYVIVPASGTQTSQKLTDLSASQNQISSQSSGTRYTSQQGHSGLNSDANSQFGTSYGSSDSNPKSYQSSYSYHKSWERQGDPYVIVPVSDNTQTSQKLTDLSGSQNQLSSQNYGTRYTKSHQVHSGAECIVCEPVNTNIRYPRSVDWVQEQNENSYDTETQQSQTGWQNIDGGQQTQSQWENSEDLGQQTQNTWDSLQNLRQQTQDFDQQSQDFGQQTQNTFDKLEDFGQQTQDVVQQTQDFGQQTQDFGQQTQNTFDKLEDFGQQTQDIVQQTQDFDQQTQNTFDKLEDLGQQTQDFGQQTQDFGQQTQDFGQQTQDFGQQTQNTFDKLEDLGQQTQDFGQQTQEFGQQTQDFGQQTQNTFDKLEDLGQQTQDFGQQIQDFGQQTQDIGQETQNKFVKLEDLGQKTQDIGQETQVFGQQSQDFGQETQDIGQETQDFGQQSQGFGQQTQDFGQQTQDFGQQIQDIGQETQNFGQNTYTEGFVQQPKSLDEQTPVHSESQENVEHIQQEQSSVFDQQTQNKWNQIEQQNTGNLDNNEGMHKPQLSMDKTPSAWDKLFSFEQNSDSQFVHHTDHTSQQSKELGPKPFEESHMKHGQQSNGQKPLNSLWGKIDNLDDDYIPPQANNHVDIYNNNFSYSLSSQSEHNDGLLVNYSESASTSNNNNNQDHSKKNYNLRPSIERVVTSTEKDSSKIQDDVRPKEDRNLLKSTTESKFATEFIPTTSTEKAVNTRPTGVGRGDIGPEEDLDYVEISTEKKHSDEHITQQISTPKTSYALNNKPFPTTTKPIVDKTMIVTPEVEKDLVQNTQQEFDMMDKQHVADDSDKNTQFVNVMQKPEEQEQQSQSVTKKENDLKFYNQNSFQHAGDAFNQHNIQSENLGHQQTWSVQHQNNEFFQHGQVYENSPVITFPSSPPYIPYYPDTELNQQNIQSFKNSWEIHHSFQNGDEFGNFNYDNYHNSDDFSHHHGFNHYGSDHNNGFQQDNKFHDFNQFNHHNVFSHNIGEKPHWESNSYQSHHVFQNQDSPIGESNSYKEHSEGILDGFEQIQNHGFHKHHTEQDFDKSDNNNEFQHNSEFHDFNQFNHHNVFNDHIGGKPHWESNSYQSHHDFQNQNSPIGEPNSYKEHSEGILDGFEQIQHHGFHKHHTEQEFDKFEQNNHQLNVEQQNMDQFLAEFSQQNQESESHDQLHDFGQKNVNDLQDFQIQEKTSELDVVPIEWNPDKQIRDDQQSIQKHTADLSEATPNKVIPNVDTPLPEPTEKPGFWKSVGNKFTSAKKTVGSWFGS